MVSTSINNSFVQVRTLPLWNEMWCRNPQEYFFTKLILMLSWLIIPFFLTVETSDTLYTASLPEIEIKADLPIRGDVVLLAKLINGEAPYEPYEGQLAVASVVVNRMAYLKKDLASVVFQRGQFDGVRSKRFKTWTREQYKIAYKALVGGITNVPSSVLFFHNKKTSTDTKWVRTLRKYEWKTIGSHTFCHSKHLIKSRA